MESFKNQIERLEKEKEEIEMQKINLDKRYLMIDKEIDYVIRKQIVHVIDTKHPIYVIHDCDRYSSVEFDKDKAEEFAKTRRREYNRIEIMETVATFEYYKQLLEYFNDEVKTN